MKIFQQREIHLAYAHSAGGGQALHLMSGSFAYTQSRTPSCFKGRRQIAHLFDFNQERLIKTARGLGVRVIQVEHADSSRQHIDLCGKPLEHAIELAKQIEWEENHGLTEQPPAPSASQQMGDK